MGDYEIMLIDNCEYNYVVYIKNRISPFSELSNLEKELVKNNCGCQKILFDMLLCRGNTSERFIECLFDGRQIVKESLRIVNMSHNNVIRDISCRIIRDNKLEDNSILTSVQKRLIKYMKI